ncbi:Uncharacterised protein [Candidatus Bilamarchaeum dharawalense]|uniref:Uncharacterized protein n=1 Tax=Candidatus Bilamarchaeum dharawalense TaxID=2885759 RepID=A0A5E4LN20_9ARCH|nr:Uncharacterised protein [Candidatus Bilamarchaeum dharawalense]
MAKGKSKKSRFESKAASMNDPKKTFELMKDHGDQIFSSLQVRYQYVALIAAIIALIPTVSDFVSQTSKTYYVTAFIGSSIVLVLYVITFYEPLILSKKTQGYYDERYNNLLALYPSLKKSPLYNQINEFHNGKFLLYDVPIFTHIMFFLVFLGATILFMVVGLKADILYLLSLIPSIFGLGTALWVIYELHVKKK